MFKLEKSPVLQYRGGNCFNFSLSVSLNIFRKPELKLLRATEEKCIFKEEVPSDLIPADLKKSESRAKQCVEGSSGASLCSIVNHKPKEWVQNVKKNFMVFLRFQLQPAKCKNL